MIHDSPSDRDYATNPPSPATHSDDGLYRTSVPLPGSPYRMGGEYRMLCSGCGGRHTCTYLGDDGVTGLWRLDL